MAKLDWGPCATNWSGLRSGLKVLVEPVLQELCKGFEDDPGSICIPSGGVLDERVEFDGLCLSVTTAPFKYEPQSRPVSLGVDRVQLALVSEGGDELLGAVVITADYSYGTKDLMRALLASTARRDTSGAGRIAILSSDRPRMTTRMTRFRESPRLWVTRNKLGVFHCGNPVCFKAPPKYLIPLENNTHDPSLQGATAYPCPNCPDPELAWALTFERFATEKDLEQKDALVLTYQHVPNTTRMITQAGPMKMVASTGTANWAGVWDPHNVPRVPEPVASMYAWAEVQQTFELLNTDASFAPWLPGILSNENLNALLSYARQIPSDAKSDVFAESMAKLFDPRQQTRFINEADDYPDAPAERYPYIALSPARFRQVLTSLDVLDLPGAFIDVGSGIGDKLFLAYAIGHFTRVEGVEYNVQSVGVSDYLTRAVTSKPHPYPISVTHEDALAYQDYGAFDVIYMYRPFRSLEQLQRLFSVIATQMKPGAVAVDAYTDSSALTRTDDGFALRDYEQGCWGEPQESVEIVYPDGTFTIQL